MRTGLVGLIAAGLAAVLWGTTGTAQALMPIPADPIAVGTLRLIVGALGLGLVAGLMRSTAVTVSNVPRGQILLAGLCMAGYGLLFFKAVMLTGVALGTVIAIGSGPVWGSILSALLGRRPSRGMLLGQCVAICGLALIISSAFEGGGDRLGMALALGAGLCYATYAVASSDVANRVPPVQLAAYTFAIAALAASPALLFAELEWLADARAVGLILFLGLVATTLAYALYTIGLQRIPAPTAISLALLEPLTAWVLAILVLRETVTAIETLGALTLLAGLWIVIRSSRGDMGAPVRSTVSAKAATDTWPTGD